MKKALSIILTFVVLLVFGSCHPDGPENIEDMDIVYTDYDPDFNFSEQNTFAIPDSIVLIDNQSYMAYAQDSIPETVDPVYGDAILNQIRENMLDLGWTEVDRTENPDVVVLVTASRTTNLFYNYDWRYWDWYYPGAYTGFGWYYPGYSPGYITSYRTGSLMIQMANVANIGVNNNVPVVWLSVINGVLEGSTENIGNRLSQTLDQAFAQSPYLNQ